MEDFGEYRGNVAGSQHSGHVEEHQRRNTEPGNWSKVDTYETDGGRGRVYEEHGQYETGPKRVRYYRRNYTSSYSSGGPVGTVDVQKEMEKLHREIQSESRNVHHMSTAGFGEHQTSESTVFGHQAGHAQRLTSASLSDQDFVEKLRLAPTQSTFGTGSHSAYERHHEAGYVTKVHAVPTSASQVDTSYGRNSLRREEEQRRFNEFRQSEYADGHRSRVISNEMNHGDVGQNMYNQHAILTPGASSQASHFREEWSSSSHARESTGPHFTQQSQQDYRNQYGNRHNSYHSGQHQTHVSEQREAGYNSVHDVKPEKLVNGLLDLGQGADCAQETQQVQYRTQYHRNYKRGARFEEFPDSQQQQQSEDLTQQNQEFGQLQQEKGDDLSQQTGQFHDTQQALGKLEFGQQSEDLTQQTTGQLEFGSQSEDLTQQNEDLTQQTMGQLEIGSQQHQQHLEDLTQQNEDLTQQTTGNLEFGNKEEQQYQQHPGDFTQQNEDLTQQTTGKLEFGGQEQQQHQQHSGDFTQQNEDLHQETIGRLEFGNQEQQQNQQHSEDFTQQNEDLIQQRTGKLEFGNQEQQQHQQHLEDFTQQNEDLTQQTMGKLEFGQQTQQRRSSQRSIDSQRFEDLKQPESDDLHQQTTGKLEFGQQIQQQPYPQKPTRNQHLEDLTHSSEADDLTQHTGGKVEFGQQTENDGLPQQPIGSLEFGRRPQNPWTPYTNQHTNDFDRTRGKLEFGQRPHALHVPRYDPNVDSWTQQTSGHDDSTQQTGSHDDFTQQTGGHDDFTQQTGGFDDFTQQTGSHDDLTQQTGRHDDFTQQTGTHDDFAQQTGRHDDFTQQTSGHDDFTQQIGKLEFSGQQQHLPKLYQSNYPTDFRHQTEGSQFGQQQHTTYSHYSQLDRTGGLNQAEQQRVGKLEMGQQTQDYHPWAPSRNQAMEDLSENSEDLTQQVGKWEFGPYQRRPYRPYPTEESRQGEGDTQKQDNIPQMGFGQTSDQTVTSESQQGVHTDNVSRPKPAQKPKPRPRYSQPGQAQVYHRLDHNQNSEQHRQDNMQTVSKPTDQHTQTPETPEEGDTPVIDFSPSDVDIEVDNDDVLSEKIRGDQGQQTTTATTTDKPKDMGQQTQVNTFDMNRGHADHSNWLHKSNDATVGWQWHYTYHPSDLTNSELTPGYHPGYGYPVSVPSKPGTTQPADERPNYDQNSEQESRPVQPIDHGNQHRPPPVGVKTSRRRPSWYFQQNNQYMQHTRNDGQHNIHGQDLWAQEQSQNSGYQQQNQQGTDEVQKAKEVGQLGSAPRQMEDDDGNKETTQRTIRIEPRILEAFGGGPYDGVHNDEIYGRITPKPSATLPPINNEDPWNVRVKPIEPVEIAVETTTEAIMEATAATEIPTEMPPPTFWGRLGNRITTTFDRARERARGIFG